MKQVKFELGAPTSSFLHFDTKVHHRIIVSEPEGAVEIISSLCMDHLVDEGTLAQGRCVTVILQPSCRTSRIEFCFSLAACVLSSLNGVC